GPTLFTSEARDGQLVTLATFRSELREHAQGRSLVIGTSRETYGETPRAYAAFCVAAATGRVAFVVLDSPDVVLFVNSGLEQFLAGLDAVVSSWPRFAASNDAAAESILAQLRAELAAIDAVAMRDGNAFWPVWLESVAL